MLISHKIICVLSNVTQLNHWHWRQSYRHQHEYQTEYYITYPNAYTMFPAGEWYDLLITGERETFSRRWPKTSDVACRHPREYILLEDSGRVTYIPGIPSQTLSWTGMTLPIIGYEFYDKTECYYKWPLHIWTATRVIPQGGKRKIH